MLVVKLILRYKGGDLMSLIFEYEKELEVGEQPFLSHEPNSVIYTYFIDGEIALDKYGMADLGNYENITFDDEKRSITTKAVTKIGVKNFPGIGGMGFYKDAYQDECRIIAPIHIKRDNMDAPVLIKAEIENGLFHIVINPPEDLPYTCYRVIAKQGHFAFEYITYKLDYFVDIPTVKGEYIVYCIGYDEANGVVSEYSNELTLTVTTGTDDWAPYYETVADIQQRVTKLETTVKDVSDLEDRTEVLENYVIGTQGSTVPFGINTYSIFSGDDSTSTTEASATIDATGEDVTIFAFVATRGTAIFPDDWEVIQQFEPTYYGTDDTRQTLTILKKIPTNNTETFTLKVSEAGRIYITLLNLSGVGKIDLYENIYNTTADDITSTYTQTINKLADVGLYVCQSISVVTGQTISITPSDNCLIIPCGSRLFVIIDNSEIISHSMSFSDNNKGSQWVSLNIYEAVASDGLLARTSALEEAIGDIGVVLDEINGVEV